MVSSVRVDYLGAVIGTRSLVDFLIDRSARLSQVIVIDSLVGEGTGIPMDRWGYRVSGGDTTDYAANRYMENPDFDTLKLATHASSGLPTKISIDSGDIEVLSDGRLKIPSKAQYARIRVSQNGDSSYHAAPPFKGYLCVYPEPQVEIEYTSEGAILSTDSPGDLSWNSCADDPYCNRQILAGPDHYKAETSGIYQLRAKYHFNHSACSDNVNGKSDSIRVEIPAGLARPSEPDAFASIRLFGSVIPSKFSVVTGASASVLVRGIDGRTVLNRTARFENGMLDLDARNSPPPGIYNFRVCIGESDCLSGFLAIP